MKGVFFFHPNKQKSLAGDPEEKKTLEYRAFDRCHSEMLYKEVLL